MHHNLLSFSKIYIKEDVQRHYRDVLIKKEQIKYVINELHIGYVGCLTDKESWFHEYLRV